MDRSLPRHQSRRRRSPPLCLLGVYDITVDENGVFHPHPNLEGGPFRSFVETTAAIRSKHFPGSSGAVCVCTYGQTIILRDLPVPQRPKEYYFTMTNRLFHLHPDSSGGPFSSLSDANAAVQNDKDSLKPPPFDFEKEGREKMERMKKFLSELNPAEYIPVMAAPQTELSKFPAASPADNTDSSMDHLEQNTCDPVLLEAIELFEKLDEEEEATRNGMKWMQKEATEAFETYLSSIETKGIKYKFQKLDYQCLICDSFPKMYHHYNFTMKMKLPSGKRWKEKTFFAEVKPNKENKKQYFCCPLELSTDNGHCNGCRNVGIDLKHPANGGYEQGNEHSGFPFDTYE